jgi:predicted HNH restriction endonuclease
VTKETKAKPVEAVVEDETGLAIVAPQAQTGKVVADFDAMLKAVEDYVEPIRGIVIEPGDEDTRKWATLVKNDLSQKRGELENARKAVKKTLMEPYDAMLPGYNKVLGVIDAEYNGIMGQLRACDEAFQSAAEAHMREYYVAIAGDLGGVIPYEAVENKRWYNRSFGQVKAENEMEDIIARAIAQRRTLQGLKLAHASEADMVFCRTLDLQAAIDEDKRITEAEQARAEHERRSAELAAEVSENQMEYADVRPVERDITMRYEMVFEGTSEQAHRIAAYVKEIGANGISLHGTEVRA